MKYIDGCAIGALTLIAAAYSALGGAALPMCLSVGACAGIALDAALRGITRGLARGSAHKRPNGR